MTLALALLEAEPAPYRLPGVVEDAWLPRAMLRCRFFLITDKDLT